MLIDLHVHSTCSQCSVLRPGEILDHARAMGLDGVCVTDHDTMAVRAHLREGFQPDGLLVIVGMEYATPQGDYLVFSNLDSLPPGLGAADLLERVRALGGAAVSAHPCRTLRPADPAILAGGPCAAVEVENGRNSKEENLRGLRLAVRLGMIQVAGSDAHSIEELGRCPTRFTVPVTSSADLADALNRGQCRPLSESRSAA